MPPEVFWNPIKIVEDTFSHHCVQIFFSFFPSFETIVTKYWKPTIYSSFSIHTLMFRTLSVWCFWICITFVLLTLIFIPYFWLSLFSPLTIRYNFCAVSVMIPLSSAWLMLPVFTLFTFNTSCCRSVFFSYSFGI